MEEEIGVGQAVELMGVENAGIDITGKRGTVIKVPGHGLVSVALDGSGDVISAWPENLKVIRSAEVAGGRGRNAKTLPTAHADAFTSVPYAGNPACVVLLPKGRAFAEAWMQKVADEMHLSETAYLVPREEPSSYDLRWFTPTSEVDLCGHATLASSHVLWDVHGVEATAPLRFHTKSGVLCATRDGSGFIELNFPSEPARAVADNDPDREKLLPAFGLRPEDVLWVGRNRMDLIAEVTPAAFARLQPSSSEIKKVACRVLSVTSAGCPVASGDDVAYDFSSRAFGPCVGIEEDPVCGSAHCCLGPYWQAKLGGKAELQARAASPRGGHVRVRIAEGGERVLLGGRAVTTMTGELRHDCVSP